MLQGEPVISCFLLIEKHYWLNKWEERNQLSSNQGKMSFLGIYKSHIEHIEVRIEALRVDDDYS